VVAVNTLPIPSLRGGDLYLEVSQRRVLDTRARLTASLPQILLAYSEYEAAHRNVAALRPIVTHPATGADLQGNYVYLRNADAANHLREAILQAARYGRCPMCGQGRVTTLDHYLPKAVFPEYSIFPANLVPACGPCNNKKRTLYEDAGDAIFLHAYYDHLPNRDRFLFAAITAQAVEIAVRFYVQPPPSIGPSMQRRIVSHFGKLGLADYYLQESAIEVSEKRHEVTRLLDEGMKATAIKAILRRQASSAAAIRGLNHWRAVLLGALAENTGLCVGIWSS
jgi:hypothetical protein